MSRVQLDGQWYLRAQDIDFSYVRSSGPGGQNVNKLATKVELRFHLTASTSLSQPQKARLAATFPSHLAGNGDFIVTSERTRSQVQNREDAVQKLIQMILSVRRPPPPRVKTQASRASKARRVVDKRRRGETKRLRRETE